MHEIQQHLSTIIKEQKLTSLFQPIVSLNKKNIFAYEALIRGPSDSPLHNPINLFSAGERYNQSLALERICRKTSIQQFAALNLPNKLFLNVSPEVLLAPGFKKGETLALLEQVGLPASRIVIEITEHQPTENYQIMRDAVSHYRNMGFEIALDDLGSGYSGLRLWTELMPDYVKIDRHFIQNIDKDLVKRNFVRSIKDMASATQCQVIAEGIETKAEFHTIQELEINFSQGYYFARPVAQPLKELSAKVFNKKKTKNKTKKKTAILNATSISKIMQSVQSISPQTCNTDVLDLFQKNSQLNVIPLVENGIPCGLIYKDQFLTKLFASRYGIDLYGKEPVQKFVDTEPFIFDHEVYIEEVSHQLTNTLHTDLAFIITENGYYQGVGFVMDLLQLITSQQLKNAQHANPLTLLPGITPINNIINNMLSEHTQFSIAYFDLDHFKPFNDIYGYEKGDQAIKLVAKLLSDCVADGSGHVGHIGGDDFIVIFSNMDWENKCKKILSDFKKSVFNFYTVEHQQATGIQAFDRTGKACFYPLLCLSIGIVDADTVTHCHSNIEIADLACEAKHHAKEISGNSYFINRRIPGSQINQHQSTSYSVENNLRLVV